MCFVVFIVISFTSAVDMDLYLGCELGAVMGITKMRFWCSAHRQQGGACTLVRTSRLAVLEKLLPAITVTAFGSAYTLLPSEHFSVEGTLIEAWFSMKSFVPEAVGKPPSPGRGRRNAERNFRGEKRANDTHSSTTEPDARLFRKGLSRCLIKILEETALALA